MSPRLTRYCGTFRKCKTHFKYAIVLMGLTIAFQCYAYLVDRSGAFYLPRSIRYMETHSHPLASSILEERSRVLTNGCDHTYSSIGDIHNHGTLKQLRANQGINLVAFLLRSRSLMYCAVPKMATKTVLSYMIYVYFLELSGYLNGSQTDTHTDRARRLQIAGITNLAKELRKVGHIIRAAIPEKFPLFYS